MRDIAFYPNKIGQKLTENQRVKQISHVLKKQYPSKFRCLDTNPESLTGGVGLPRIKMYIPSVKTIKTMK